MKSLKLKIGDRVQVKLPMNANIVSKNQKEGYTLQTDNGDYWRYLTDEDVKLVKVKK